MKSKLQILIDARALIERRENWCQRVLWLHNGGSFAFCSRGALIDAADHEPAAWDINFDVLVILAAALPIDWLPHEIPMTRAVEFNNSHSHAEVIAWFDRAIESERARESIGKQVRAIIDDALHVPPSSDSIPAPTLLVVNPDHRKEHSL